MKPRVFLGGVLFSFHIILYQYFIPIFSPPTLTAEISENKYLAWGKSVQKRCPVPSGLIVKPSLGHQGGSLEVKWCSFQCRKGRVAHVAGAKISQKPLFLTSPASGLLTQRSEYLPGSGKLSTCR